MITGEHAVLHGARALVGAVDARVRVVLTPCTGRRVDIRSALGTRQTSLDAPDISPPFQFVGRALQLLGPGCPSGFALEITADMPPDVGLGSSAAVTVATLAALHAWGGSQGVPDPVQLHREALAIVRDVQGAASGADLAASVWGGVLLYRQTPAVLRRHTLFPGITLVYAGYKTTTAEVIRQVESRRATAPAAFDSLYARMDACTEAADAAFADADWPRLAFALQQGQSLMEELGVCDATLADIIRHLRSTVGIASAKISGSGLGDCVLALGHPAPGAKLPYRQIPVRFSGQGLTLEP
jgi:mevalonate kinase